MKGISALVMLSEGTLLSGGERDRKIIAWDTLQNYKKITETKVGGLHTKRTVVLLYCCTVVLAVSMTVSLL
jgi:microtubule-associated protein-like 1/2